VELTAHLHDAASLQHQLQSCGLAVEATLVRSPRSTERHEQAMILARSR